MKRLHIAVILLLSVIQPFGHALEIGSPVPHIPMRWKPDAIVSFGDSLTDSHGDSIRSRDEALSTYNLLRTLKGERVEQSDGSDKPPIDISELISQRSSIENIKATFELYVREIEHENREKRFFGKLFGGIKKRAVDVMGSLLVDTLEWFDRFEEVADRALLPPLRILDSWLESRLKGKKRKSLAFRSLSSLKSKTEFMVKVVEADLEDFVLARSEELLIGITAKLGAMIPLIPDSDYYVTGKWTAGKNMDLMWIEVLIRMMSTKSHEIILDNRAMAGSWVLCAPSKLGRMDALRETTDAFNEGVMLLFQGSLIPPCEGAIVTSYLNEQRRNFNDETGRYPYPDEPYIQNDTLVIFFNGSNDFLNEWSDPDYVAQEQEYDIRNILDAGAEKVAVVLLPDISRTPRFRHSDQAEEMSERIAAYNASMAMRLTRIWSDYGGADTDRVLTIDGNRLFTELQNEDRWDLDQPILNIPIPGVDDETTGESEQNRLKQQAVASHDFISKELLENKAFNDNWRIRKANKAQHTNKIPFFADSVHPSAEAHYAIAEKACSMMNEKFNIPCNPQNYSEQQARRESSERQDKETQRDEL